MSRLKFGLTIVLLTVLIDQAIKLWVESALAYQQKIDVLPFIALFRTHNFGIAFSMLRDAGPWLLVGVALVVIAFVIWLWRGSPANRCIAHLGYGLIVGGAIGNLIDRFVLGYVVDYFLFHTQSWSFAVFNLADAAISVGAALVVLDELLIWKRDRGVDADG